MPILRKPLAVASFVIVPSLNATAWAAASPNEAAASAISSDQMSILIGMGAILCLLVIISAALILNLQAQARALASAHPELRERYYSLPFGVPEGTVRGLVSVLIIIMGIAILVVQGPLGIESTEAIAGFISAVIAFYFVTREQAATTGALRDSNAAMRAAASDVARANETLSRVVLRADISSPDKSSRSAAERALANRIILEEVQAQRPDVDAETAIFDMGIGTVDAVVSKAATRYRAVVRDGSKFEILAKRVVDEANTGVKIEPISKDDLKLSVKDATAKAWKLRFPTEFEPIATFKAAGAKPIIFPFFIKDVEDALKADPVLASIAGKINLTAMNDDADALLGGDAQGFILAAASIINKAIA